jgi:hypothetical protein
MTQLQGWLLIAIAVAYFAWDLWAYRSIDTHCPPAPPAPPAPPTTDASRAIDTLAEQNKRLFEALLERS